MTIEQTKIKVETIEVSQKIDFAEESKKLKTGEEIERLPWFSPDQGQHKVLVLEVGGEYQNKFEDGKILNKVRIVIEVNKERKNWGITKGQTSNSLWGQLVTIAAKNKNKLEGQLLNLVVKGKGKQKQYTILEAV